MDNDVTMLDEYDFSGGVRGKYYQRYRESVAAGVIHDPRFERVVAAREGEDKQPGQPTPQVHLDPDLREQFPTSDAVNAALRDYARILEERRRTA